MSTLTPDDRDRLRALADEYDDSTIDGGPDAAAGAIRRLLEALDRAEAERDHLATQEPTDTEVEAAAVALAVEGDDIGEWDSLSTYAQATYLRDARAALSAARATRRDEEKQA